MAGKKPLCQWYQTENTVNASLKLKPSGRGEIIVHFGDYHCTVSDGGVLYWECYLADQVVPDLCRVNVGRVRAEINFRKFKPVQWVEFEVLPWATSDKKLSSTSMNSSCQNIPKALPVLSKVSGQVFSPEDMMFINHLPHDHYDLGGDTVKVKVRLCQVDNNHCSVSFEQDHFELKFRTSDGNFLRMYEGTSPNTTFVWRIHLYASVDPGRSEYKLKPTEIEISLKKVSSVRWKALESFSHSRTIIATNNTLSSPVADQPSGDSGSGAGLNDDWKNLVSDAHVNSASRQLNDLESKENVDSASQQLSDLDSKGSIHSARDKLNDLDSKENIDSATHRLNDRIIEIENTVHQDSQECVGRNDIGSITSNVQPQPAAGSTQRNNFDLHDSGSQPIYNATTGNSQILFNRILQGTSRPDQQETITPSNKETQESPTPSAPSDHTPPQMPEPSSKQGAQNHDPSNIPSGIHNVEITSSNHHASNVVCSKSTTDVLPPALVASDPSHDRTHLRKPCLTGLCNLGNSCFMNSVVQCLSNTGDLREYFIDGRYFADINKDNPLGFKGKLAKCFCQVIRKLWSGKYRYFAPSSLKSVVSLRNSHFGGYQQQDAHEFMSYLLDGLHEDLNRVKKKPLTLTVDSDNRPDTEVAEQSWAIHMKRNDSFFVDRLQGQFKSTLVCPECSMISVTFDPFMSMSVPIPKNLRHLPVIFVPCDPVTMPTKFVLKLSPEGNLELLKASVARKTGIPLTQLRVFEAFNGKFQSLLSSNQHPIKSIRENDVIIVSEVLSEREASGEVVEVNVIQRVQFPLFPSKCSSCSRLASDMLVKEGDKIQRCSKCKAVGYCDRKCQQKDWSSHKMTCRQGRPTPIGLPFVVSLPASQFTYSRLSSMAEIFARRSVEVKIRKSLSESETTSCQGDVQECLKDGIASVNTSDDTDTMYMFVNVNRHGDNKETCRPLDKNKDGTLSIEGQFLAMDWRNNLNDDGCVMISPKLTMDHQLDPTATAENSSRNKDVSLEQCLELFTEPELLSKDEAWYCPQCKKHEEATKQISVWRLPAILILHLKRFSVRNMVWRDKINEMVSFPVRGLNMSSYMLGDACKQVSSDHPPLYDLYAIVNHYGLVHAGHYTAMVKPPTTEGLKENDWLCYDDENFYTVPEVKVQTKDAYVLFYVRRDQCVQNKL